MDSIPAQPLTPVRAASHSSPVAMFQVLVMHTSGQRHEGCDVRLTGAEDAEYGLLVIGKDVVCTEQQTKSLLWDVRGKEG